MPHNNQLSFFKGLGAGGGIDNAGGKRGSNQAKQYSTYEQSKVLGIHEGFAYDSEIKQQSTVKID